MEQQISNIQEQVTQLRISYAQQATSIDHLAKAVEQLSGNVSVLNANMNKGKGALWMFGALAATLGGLVSWATTTFFPKG